MRRAIRAVVSAMALWMACGTAAQSQPPRDATFKVGVEGVRVDVLVTKGDTPIAGLQSSDFELFDNGALQRVDAVSLAELPIDVLLTLDVSTSVAGERLTNLREAARALVDALRDGDRAALLTFSHAINLLTPLTPALDDVRAQLAIVSGDGYTSLGDATYVALTLPVDVRRSSLIVLFGDGGDTASWLSNATVLDAARRSGSVVSVVATGLARSEDRELAPWMRPNPGDPDVAMLASRGPDAAFSRFLDDVATATGGNVIELEQRAPLREAFLSVLERFRARYQLTYTLTGTKPGGVHRIDVRVKRPGARVRSRPVYVR